LAILHCSGHNDPTLVRKIWEHIIKRELGEGKITPLMEKVRELGKEYPLVRLLIILEIESPIEYHSLL
jgi:hypothetical protein